MKNSYEELDQKINEALAADEVYNQLNDAAEECKAVFAAAEQQAPIMSSSAASPEEFALKLCSGSTSQYYAEVAEDEVDEYLDQARKHAAFHEYEQSQACLNAAEQLRNEIKEYNSFSNQQLNALRKATEHLEALHKQMSTRLHEVTREAIKQNYYTKSVQNIFAAVESKEAKLPNDDRLDKVIIEEVNKFIAARDYQIPPREAQPRK